MSSVRCGNTNTNLTTLLMVTFTTIKTNIPLVTQQWILKQIAKLVLPEQIKELDRLTNQNSTDSKRGYSSSHISYVTTRIQFNYRLIGRGDVHWIWDTIKGTISTAVLHGATLSDSTTGYPDRPLAWRGSHATIITLCPLFAVAILTQLRHYVTHADIYNY